MPISLRIPPAKEEVIHKLAKQRGKTKTAIIMEALDEKLGLAKSRESLIREAAGWMTPSEASELRETLAVFDRINEGDWPS